MVCERNVYLTLKSDVSLFLLKIYMQNYLCIAIDVYVFRDEFLILHETLQQTLAKHYKSLTMVHGFVMDGRQTMGSFVQSFAVRGTAQTSPLVIVSGMCVEQKVVGYLENPCRIAQVIFFISLIKVINVYVTLHTFLKAVLICQKSATIFQNC